MKIAKRNNVHIVSTFHSKYREDIKSVFKLDVVVDVIVNNIVRYYNNVYVVLVPSKSTTRTLREYGYNGPVEELGIGTYITEPKDLSEHKRKAREKIGIHDNEIVLFYLK